MNKEKEELMQEKLSKVLEYWSYDTVIAKLDVWIDNAEGGL